MTRRRLTRLSPPLLALLSGLGFAATSLGAPPAPASVGPAFGGGAAPLARVDQLAPADRRAVARALRRASRASGKAVPAPYGFFPQAGATGHDIFLSNFVDLDPASPGTRDFECSGYTYDGHQGHDALIRSFGEQDIGVPVYAALDATVLETHDGEFDRQTEWLQGVRANFVALDHGAGHVTIYYHFRRGSVAVAPGQRIPAGTVLGLTGSSGFSSAPHLHFESRLNGGHFEPSSGPCQPASTQWEEQPPIERSLYPRDVYFSTARPPETWPAYLDDATPRLGTVALGTSGLYLQVSLQNLPGASGYRLALLAPDGGEASVTSGSFEIENLAKYSWWYWRLAPTLAQAGTWTAVLAINGHEVLRAPLLVSEAPPANRPPRAVDGLRLAPRAPDAARVTSCVVAAPLVGGDPDYDVLRYRYEWRVNGELRRTATSAATTDVLPRGAVAAGDRVECRVVPSDGEADGPAAIAGSEVPAPCVADARTLCLLGGRYQVRATWRNQFDGSHGEAGVIPESDFVGFLWFTAASNPELLVKILDFDGTIKLFYGQLTDLGLELTVTESATGRTRVYRNGPEDCGAIDQDAFPKSVAPPLAGAGTCQPSATAICLLDRYRVRADWRNQYDGSAGGATGRALAGGLAGVFSYRDPANVELLVKALDFGDRVLFLWGALSDLGYTLLVEDTVTGVQKAYVNPSGRFCGGIDPAAF